MEYFSFQLVSRLCVHPLGREQWHSNQRLYHFLGQRILDGANWTFIAWGGLNALCFVPIILMKRNRKNLDHVDNFWPDARNFSSILLTFSLTVLAWIFYKAESMAHAFDYLARIFSFKGGKWYGGDYLPLAAIMLVWEWTMRKRNFGLDFRKDVPKWLR